MESKKIKNCMLFISILSGVIGGFLIGFYNNRCIKVVVTDKGDNKIAFKKLDAKKDTAIRIIQFEDIANGMDYYKFIKVNDTLKVSKINEDLVYGNSYGMLNASRIKTVNGKTLEEIKEIAKRDTLLKQINMSNKKVR